MTATDVTTATPAAGAEATSTSKESSPVKVTKTPEQVKDEAATLIAVGKRDLLLNNIPDAVSSLAQACELLSKQFGETAKECAEVYFYYGKSLLELSRMESGVLGNALEGVPEEESENNTSQFEDPAKMTDQEKNEVTDNVTEALEENFKDLEEKKKSSEASKDGEKKEDSKTDAEKEKTDDKEEAKVEGETAKTTEEVKSSEEAKSSDDSKSEEAKPNEGESKEGEDKAEDEAMEEDEEGTEDEETEDSSDEKKEETTEEKKDEEEEPSNLQLSWEMLELAKVVYSKQLEAGDGDKAHLEERLCSTILALGEVSIENENYKQAVDDIQECLKKQENMPKDARIVAETHYQLGVAQGFNAQHDEAVESLKSAITILQERIKNLEKTETEETKKEVTELKALIPEIEEKINDTKDMKKEAESKKDEVTTTSSGDAFGSSKTAEVKPVSSIAVKRKAEDDDTANKKIAAEKETAAAS
eukprot:TRINITY_DN2873_c0_g1_i1.p1 TRINITY_DN2873_c0_g1~~TRINITY_DN2873_c0_g1_i1.p1  ORF type:complete len:491 (-),score=242.71 TRINITY_DN2873_c0_g1_i1:105-1529(-)